MTRQKSWMKKLCSFVLAISMICSGFSWIPASAADGGSRTVTSDPIYTKQLQANVGEDTINYYPEILVHNNQGNKFDTNNTNSTIGAGRYWFLQFDVNEVIKQYESTGTPHLVGAKLALTNSTTKNSAGDVRNVYVTDYSDWAQYPAITMVAGNSNPGKALINGDAGDYTRTKIGSGKIQNKNPSTTQYIDLPEFPPNVSEEGIVNLIVGDGNPGNECFFSTGKDQGVEGFIETWRPHLLLEFSNSTVEEIQDQHDVETLQGAIDSISANMESNFLAGQSFVFPEYSDDPAVEVSWESSNSDVFSVTKDADGATIGTATELELDSADATADVTLTVTKRRSVLTKTFVFTIQALQSGAPTEYGKVSLEGLVDLADEYIDEYKDKLRTGKENYYDGDGYAGYLLKDEYDSFKALVEEAKSVLNDDSKEDQCGVYASRIITAGTDLMSTGKIDNTVVHDVKKGEEWLDNGRELLYSTERSQLVSLVWKAKATLLYMPMFTTRAAKNYVQSEITHAEKVLAWQYDSNGNPVTSQYQYPWTNYREFYNSPDDARIKECLSFNTYWSETINGGENPSLPSLLGWYDRQYMFYNTYMTSTYYATAEGSSDPNNRAQITAGGTHANPEDRPMAYIEFDISDLEAGFQGASFVITNAGGTTGNSNVNYIRSTDPYPDVPVGASTPIDKYALWDTENDVPIGSTLGTINPKQNVTVSVNADAAVMDAFTGNKKVLITLTPKQTGGRVVYYGSGAQLKSYRPHLDVSINQINRGKFQEKYEHILKVENLTLDGADEQTYDDKNLTVSPKEAGAKVGDYPISVLKKSQELLREVKQLYANGDTYETAVKLIELRDNDALLREKRVLLTDIDEDNTLFFTGEDAKTFKERVMTNDTLKSYYTSMKSEIDQYDADESIRLYEETSKNNIDMWKNTNSYTKMTTTSGGSYITGNTFARGDMPAGTEQKGYCNAYLEISMDPSDNMEDGLGEGWIDNIYFTTLSGNDFSINNQNFNLSQNGEPVGWTYCGTGNAVKGYAQAADDRSQKPWSGKVNVQEGAGALYLCNPDSNSSCVWKSDVFKMPYDGYTMWWYKKQYAKFTNYGIRLRFVFCDDDGNEMKNADGSLVATGYKWFNSKGYPEHAGSGGSISQKASICYLVTGEEKYAKIAKAFLQLHVEEFAQAARHVEFVSSPTGNRPDGYGMQGVQVGRNLQCFAATYAIIKHVPGLFTREEKEKLKDQIEYLIRDIMTKGDYCDFDYETASAGASNWQTDEAEGGAMAAMAWEEDGLADARLYINNGLRTIKGCVESQMMPDGAWPESIRYHVSTVQKLLVFAKAVESFVGDHMLSDPEAPLVKGFNFMARIQTPKGILDAVDLPPFGDANLESGWSFYMFGQYYDDVYKMNPELGALMYKTWLRAGKPSPGISDEAAAIAAFFGHTVDIPQEELDAVKLDTANSGLVAWCHGEMVQRNNWGDTSKETYVAMHAQDKDVPSFTAHSHQDQTAIIFFADSTSLLIDPGITSYWNAEEKAFCRTPHGHSMVQYRTGPDSYVGGHENSSGCTGNEYTDRLDDIWYTSDELDIMGAETTDMVAIPSEGKEERQIALVKDGFEAMVVWDQVSGATDYGTRLNSIVMAKNMTPEEKGDTVKIQCFNDIDLNIIRLQGGSTYTNKQYLASGDYPTLVGESTKKCMQFSLYNEGNDDYLTVYFPETPSRGSLTNTKVYEKDGVGIYKLSHSSGVNRYVAVNSNKENTSETVPVSGLTLTDLKTGTTFANELTIAGDTMMVLSDGTKSSSSDSNSNNGGSTGSTGSSGMPVLGGNTVSTGGGASSGNGDNSGDANNGSEIGTSAVTAPTFVGKQTIGVGESFRFAMKNVDKNATVTVKSSNSKVAAVSKKGNVRGKKAGTATITVTVKQSGIVYKNKVKVTVRNKKTGVSSVKYRKPVANAKGAPVLILPKTLAKGSSEKLGLAGVSDNAVVKYTSGDKSVAAVTKSGKITGKKAGTANVKVTVTQSGVVTKHIVKVTVK